MRLSRPTLWPGDRSAALLAWALAGLGTAGAALVLASDAIAVEAVAYPGVATVALAVGAVLCAVRFGRLPITWALVLAGAATWLAGDLLWSLADVAGRPVPFPSAIDAVYLAGYPLVVGGIVVLWRRLATSLGVVLESAVLATVVGLFVWAAVVDRDGGSASLEELVVAVAYPTFDVFVLVLLGQLLLVGALGGNRSLQALVLGTALFLASDLAFAHAVVRDAYVSGGWRDLGWLACYALWGAAAAHPATRALADEPKREIQTTVARIAALGAACILAPAALVLQARSGEVTPGVFALSGTLLIALVFWRMGLIFSEQRRASEALRKSRELYGVLVDESRDMISLVDGAGRIVFASPSHLDALGYPPDDLVGRDALDLVHPDDREPVLAARDDVLAGRLRSVPPFRLVRADGELVWVETTLSRLEREAHGGSLVLTSTRDVSERLRAEQALAETTRTLRTLVDTAPVAIVAVDLDWRVTIWNPQAEATFGWTAAEVVGKENPLRPLREGKAMLERVAREGRIREEGVRRRKDGGEVEVILDAVPARDAAGAVAGAFAVFVDVSERRQLEEQLRQAQKMEAIGQLAGGIAHDFNNLLTAISGYTAFALERAAGDERLHGDLEEVARAGERAAELTRQLLAFSRRQLLQATPFDLNDAVVQTTGLLGRVLGEHIRIVTSLDPAGCPVLADQGQIEQVLMNLAVNARDAQPEGGTLALETETVTLDAATAGPELAPGRYARLRVSDTGAGMDAETTRHAFEPFFTTKEPGKGSGLGLAMVYGIVTQSGGRIGLTSAPGAGTTFEILLPCSERPSPREADGGSTAPRGRERILLVEDEAVVRELTREMLEQCGYAVVCAPGPTAALELADANAVDLLLTDVVMPGMNGRRLAATLRRERPDLPVVYTSGYSDDAALREGSLEANAAFLQKPYSAHDLAEVVRATLDG